MPSHAAGRHSRQRLPTGTARALAAGAHVKTARWSFDSERLRNAHLAAPVKEGRAVAAAPKACVFFPCSRQCAPPPCCLSITQKLLAGIIGSSWKICILSQISLKLFPTPFPAALVGSISGVSTRPCWAGRFHGQRYHAGSSALFTSCRISTVTVPSIPCPGVG